MFVFLIRRGGRSLQVVAISSSLGQAIFPDGHILYPDVVPGRHQQGFHVPTSLLMHASFQTFNHRRQAAYSPNGRYQTFCPQPRICSGNVQSDLELLRLSQSTSRRLDHVVPARPHIGESDVQRQRALRGVGRPAIEGCRPAHGSISHHRRNQIGHAVQLSCLGKQRLVHMPSVRHGRQESRAQVQQRDH